MIIRGLLFASRVQQYENNGCSGAAAKEKATSLRSFLNRTEH